MCFFLYGSLMAQMFVRVKFLSVHTAGVGQFACWVVPRTEVDTLQIQVGLVLAFAGYVLLFALAVHVCFAFG